MRRSILGVATDVLNGRWASPLELRGTFKNSE
jgi:hypothetical protein